MAVTRLADVVIPEVFTNYVNVLTAERSAFRASGVLVDFPLLNDLLSGGADTFQVPHFQDLANTEANVSGDNPSTTSSPEKISTGKEIAKRHNRNQSWSSMDLVAQLAGADPMEAIASRVADYWVRQEQRMLISALQGVFANNEETPGNGGNDGDMVNNIALGGAGSPTAANLFSAEAFIDAQQTLGDAAQDLSAVAMHSVVFSRAKKNNLIDFIPDSQGAVDIPVFLGLRVIVDDGLPAVAVSGNVEYSTYLFGAGAVLRGDSSPRVPTEVDRAPAAGNGGGQEILYSRVEWVHHPRGFQWLGAVETAQSPTNAELQNADNWLRVFPERKQVKIAELRTNG